MGGRATPSSAYSRSWRLGRSWGARRLRHETAKRPRAPAGARVQALRRKGGASFWIGQGKTTLSTSIYSVKLTW